MEESVSEDANSDADTDADADADGGDAGDGDDGGKKSGCGCRNAGESGIDSPVISLVRLLLSYARF